MTDPHELVHRYLDDLLNEAERALLNAWIRQSPDHAREFAALVRLHDRLRNEVRADRAIRLASAAEAAPAETRPERKRSWFVFAGGIASLVAVAIVGVWLLLPAVLSAAGELDRLIVASSGTGDRTYVIRNLDPQPAQPDERRPPLDGATLHVRGHARYVLVRHFPDGRTFVTGSDGERSWAVPPTGAVRVSGDPERFRGPVPGHQHGIPFADLHSDLVQLREAYDLTLLPSDADGLRGLLAEKRSPEYRGPRRVELWYTGDGVVRRMTFDGLPRARGGPTRVSVELLDTRDLGPDFFRHASHHAADRRVIEED